MKHRDSVSDASHPASPCVNICRMDPHSGLCEGCLRTLDEISQWSAASASRKQAIWRAIQSRAQSLAPSANEDQPAPERR